ncbi:Sterol biosynthesis ERG24/DHCR-like - like 2 [Theobroma cacao]|nr:Sterol biosynthesis ERG24/DHCR-like - like 2 [Theobroma cacao]
MDLGYLLQALIPSWNSVAALAMFFAYLAIAGSILPGKLVPGVTLQDGSRLHYRCNGFLALVLLVGLLGIGFKMNFVSPTPGSKQSEKLYLFVLYCTYIEIYNNENLYLGCFPHSNVTAFMCPLLWKYLQMISDRGFELLSATLIFSFLVMLVLYAAGCRSGSKGSSLKPHITGNLIHDWWYGIQLNPQFLGIDLKFFFVRAGMMGWLLINLSILAKSVQDGSLSESMILYQLFCLLYIVDYFVHEEYMTSTWDIIAERLGFMLVFGDLVWIPFTFSIQALHECCCQNQLMKVLHALCYSHKFLKGWWLLNNKVELTTAAAIANCFVFLIGYLVFRGANKQKHVFKKNPKALIWGKPPKVIGGKLLASGYWGIARHSNYLGDLLLALSFSLPCGISSPIPYFYPIYLFILLVWRERRDEARCAEKYKEIWAEYCRLVPWRIFPYLY